MTSASNPTVDEELKKEIYAAMHDGIVLATDNGQPYLAFTDQAEDAILAIIHRERTAAQTELLDDLEKKVIGLGGVYAPALTVDRLQSFIAALRTKLTGEDKDNE